MQDRRPILIEDVSIDAAFQPYRDVAKQAGFVSVASVPLVTSSTEFIGVLSVHFANTGSMENHVIQELAGLRGPCRECIARTFLTALVGSSYWLEWAVSGRWGESRALRMPRSA
jgi:GAF domain-containing protein